MVPAYRLPQGFSSTYHRHLYGMDPLVICGVPEDALPANTAPGVFYPTVVGLKGAPADEGAQRAAEQPPRVLLQPAQAAKKAPARPR